MDTFGKRLKSERVRLGLTQEGFGEACGRKNIMQMNYEKDKGFPDVPYLLQAAGLGADLAFLITGQHSGQALAEDETLLLASYRAQSSQGKAAVLGTLAGLAGTRGYGNTGALPASALREWRILTLLRSCPEAEQTIFEEFVRNLAQAIPAPVETPAT